jgi:hypothetical protein
MGREGRAGKGRAGKGREGRGEDTTGIMLTWGGMVGIWYGSVRSFRLSAQSFLYLYEWPAIPET